MRTSKSSRISKLAYGLLTVLLVGALAACGNDNDSANAPASGAAASAPSASAAASGTAEAGDNSAIQDGTTKLQDVTKQLQDAIAAKNLDETKKLGKSVNEAWLSYENAVRQAFPLEYTEVEKYVMPIFSASAYDNIDFDALSVTAGKLQDALTALKNAKPTTASTNEQLLKAVDNYKTYVQEQADEMVAKTKLFADAVKAGNIDEAKRLYPQTRVNYERIEPIAESFGDLDPRIDAREADVEEGAEWTGIHRLEKALWVENSLEGMDKYADQLVADVQELQAKVASFELEPKGLVAGAMELLNEAATSKITGEEEIFSHVDLVDFASNVEGSKTVYLSIIPALNEKNPDLGNQLDTQFQKMEQVLLTHQTNGEYVTYDKLTDEQIRAISDELSLLSTLMSQTASIL